MFPSGFFEHEPDVKLDTLEYLLPHHLQKKVSHINLVFLFVLTLFGFQLSPLVLQMSDVSRSKRVVLCSRPNIAGNGLPICVVGELDALTFNFAQM